MKILSLNTWGGRAGKDKLLSFIEHQAEGVDVFCFQEIWSAPYKNLEGINAGGLPIKHEDIMVYGKQEISALLAEYNAFFHPSHLEDYGLLMMVHKRYSVLNAGEVFVYREKGYVPPTAEEIGDHARNIQYVTLMTPHGPLAIMNFHGLWNGKGKGDSEERLVQSNKIIDFLKTIHTPVVFMGDFNLLPDTQSMHILEEYNLRNLIKEYGIESTRTSFYTKPEKFADYALVSRDIEVKHFEVLLDEVSDHAPLLLEI